ncbi:protein psi1-like [Vicia villosa]|uniref:protein psi1-like n=1 Tax=Vicia villosa TaxID=3911 RepID=UPI00273B2462|nr:protein psi1-like [Vicia villosa]
MTCFGIAAFSRSRLIAESLEELYKGTTKKMKISREITYASGKTLPVKEILAIEIQLGWKKGTKITFPELDCSADMYCRGMNICIAVKLYLWNEYLLHMYCCRYCIHH